MTYDERMSFVNRNASLPVLPDGIEAPSYSSSPDEIKKYVRQLHATELKIADRALDSVLLGEGVVSAEQSMADSLRSKYDTSRDLHETFQGEQPWLGGGTGIWTPYEMVRDITRDHLKLNESHTLEDWGAGWGRVVLYAGITSVAKCRGIELMPDRVARVQAAIDKLELENTEFIQSKIQDHDPSDADVIFMYEPFSQKTFESVYGILGNLADSKPLTIAYRGWGLNKQVIEGRFEQLALVKRIGRVDYYETRDIAYTPASRVANPDRRERMEEYIANERRHLQERRSWATRS